MSGSIKNMLVGIFVLSAITLLVITILFLRPTVGDGKHVLSVRFSDIGSLNVGTRVLFSGKPVGEVVAMVEIENARDQPTDQLGRVYFYELTLHLNSSVKVYNTDEISIQTSGLMGEKSIAITPKAPPLGVTPTLITSQPIYADSVDTLQNALIDFSDLSATMEETFKHMGAWIKDHGAVVASTIHSAGGAMEQIDRAVDSINKANLVDDIQKGTQELAYCFNEIGSVIEQMDEEKTFKNVGIMMENLSSASQSIDEVAHSVAEGKGTLGKVLVDSDLYLEMNSILSKTNGLMNDINHYGILFHLNKQWQRTRLQKVSSLNALSSPQSFRSYFEMEVDDINASMSRLSMLIEKAELSPVREEVLHSKAFRNDFAELMRKVDELSGNLRLYNQKLSQAVGN